MDHEVFISYHHSDKKIADAISHSLEANCINCWIAPRNVTPGVVFEEAIVQAISSCKIMVLVFSSETLLSSHVKNEVTVAFNRKITIIPFKIDDSKPSGTLEYYLQSVHWIDAMSPPLYKHIFSLVKTSKEVLKSSAADIKLPDKLLKRLPFKQPIKKPIKTVYINWKVIAYTSILIILALCYFIFSRVSDLEMAESYVDQKDWSNAIKYFDQAIEKGVPDAYAGKGMLYKEGKGVLRDLGKAAELFRIGASKGSSECRVRLADNLLVSKDNSPADKLLHSNPLNESEKAKSEINNIKNPNKAENAEKCTIMTSKFGFTAKVPKEWQIWNQQTIGAMPANVSNKIPGFEKPNPSFLGMVIEKIKGGQLELVWCGDVTDKFADNVSIITLSKDSSYNPANNKATDINVFLRTMYSDDIADIKQKEIQIGAEKVLFLEYVSGALPESITVQYMIPSKDFDLWITGNFAKGSYDKNKQVLTGIISSIEKK